MSKNHVDKISMGYMIVSSMKSLYTTLTALVVASLMTEAHGSTLLQSSANLWLSSQTTASKKSGPTDTQKLIKKLDFIQTKPNVKADYFILLNTASWCPPCRKAMPGVVEAYKDIKASKKVELIILSADNSEDAAKAYLKGYKAKIPAVMGTPKIPGYVPSNGIPNVTIIDKDGKTVVNGGPNLIIEWKKHTLDKS